MNSSTNDQTLDESLLADDDADYIMAVDLALSAYESRPKASLTKSSSPPINNSSSVLQVVNGFILHIYLSTFFEYFVLFFTFNFQLVLFIYEYFFSFEIFEILNFFLH